MFRLILVAVLVVTLVRGASAQDAIGMSETAYQRLRAEAIDGFVVAHAPVTVTVRWTPTTIQIEMPDPYRVWFVQFSWVESSPTLEIVQQPLIVAPPVGRWQDGAYNPDCTVCDADSTTVVGIVNLIDYEGGGFQERATAKVVDFTWSWQGIGVVTLGHELMCDGFRNNPCHLWVHDISLPTSDPRYDQVWYCDAVETRLGVETGVLTWDWQPLSIPDETPLAVNEVAWSTVKGLYR